MKKKILIVSSSLSTGGLEKCTINLCDNFDYDKYEIDLYLFNEGRALLEKLNKNVNLLPDSPYYSTVYNMPFGKSVKTLIKAKKFRLAFYRVGRFIRSRLKRVKYTQNDWKQMKKTMLKIGKHYDVAIGFEEGTACYYVAECVNADRKIGWIHTDIKKINTNRSLDKKAFEMLDKIVTVSQNSLNSLIEEFPTLKDKFCQITIAKLVNDKELLELSKMPNCIKFDGTKILSIGRLVELKGFHLCVPVVRRLLDEGYSLCWYVAGEGPFRSELEAEIEKYNVKDNFILLGNCANPYSLINSADICVQPSSYEGYSVAVFEEKYFYKPVVVTDIPSNLEMIEDRVNGIVVKRDSDDIYRGIKLLLDDSDLREKIAITKAKGDSTNKDIINSIEKLFEK